MDQQLFSICLGICTRTVSWITFAIASTIGKIPALLIEVYSVNEVMNGSLVGKVILVAVALGIFTYIWNIHKQKAKK